METKLLFESRGQGQVFQFWNELGESERIELVEQAKEIDLGEIEALVAAHLKGEGPAHAVDFDALRPAPYLELPSTDEARAAWQAAKQEGERLLRAGKVAAFTVAGGQGTRLGYDGPKGTYPVTPVKGKSLFQVFAEKILAARRAYGCALPWFIMTSQINHEATESFFRDNGFFGLASDSVHFFKQGRMPAVDYAGKILLEAKGRIAMSPDGHGGALRAMERSGALDLMERLGVEIISYFQVDNPLVQPIDPAFLGFHQQSGSTMSSKMLPKAYEKEKLGHFCVIDGRTTIVEYSDMPDALTSLRDADGKLSFRAGSIAIHLISVSFARELASGGGALALPFHRADKKIPYVDAAGKVVSPSAPNGVKFEMFVFDAIPFSKRPLILETTRLGDFSPVKNAEGVDSPATCKADQIKLFAGWLGAAGVEVPPGFVGNLEISPLFGWDEASFLQSWKRSPQALDFGRDVYIG